MYKGYSSHLLIYYVDNKVLLSFLWRFQDMYCVDFIQIALFKSSGDIYWSPLPFLLLDELLVKRDSDGFFPRRLEGTCRSSDSYNSTDSSLNIVNCQLAWLGFLTSSWVL